MRSSTPQFDSDEELNLINPEPAAFEASTPPQEDSVMEHYNSIPTPERCVADFCLIPIGTPSASVSNEVAAVQRLMKSCGLEYSMHSAGTTVEGSWDDVMEVIGKAHSLVHQNGIARVQTDIRAGSRTDKVQHFSEKVAKVESLLANDSTVPTPSSTPTSTTSISPPRATSQLTSISTNGPWISASMHLRRTFVPHNNEQSTSQNALVRKAGVSSTSLEFKTGFEGFAFRHVVYCFMTALMVKNLLFPSDIPPTYVITHSSGADKAVMASGAWNAQNTQHSWRLW